jgi:hypothetical protein
MDRRILFFSKRLSDKKEDPNERVKMSGNDSLFMRRAIELSLENVKKEEALLVQ